MVVWTVQAGSGAPASVHMSEEEAVCLGRASRISPLHQGSCSLPLISSGNCTVINWGRIPCTHSRGGERVKKTHLQTEILHTSHSHTDTYHCIRTSKMSPRCCNALQSFWFMRPRTMSLHSALTITPAHTHKVCYRWTLLSMGFMFRIEYHRTLANWESKRYSMDIEWRISYTALGSSDG